MRATVGWGFGSGAPPFESRASASANVSPPVDRMGARSRRKSAAWRSKGVAAVAGANPPAGLHRARVGRGPHPERVARRAGATRGGRGRIRRSGRGGPVVQRAEFLRAGDTGDRIPGSPPQSTGTSVGVRRQGMMPRMPLTVRKELRRGGRRGQHLPPRSRACIAPTRPPDPIGHARSAARRPPRARRAASRPASWHRLAARAGFFRSASRAETAGREALIECSDAPGRS